MKITDYTLYCFDIDSTLIEPHFDGKREVRPYDDIVWLPGRLERLRAMYNYGASIALVTNQGGVAFGFTTIEQVEAKNAKIREAITDLRVGESTDHHGLEHLPIFACFAHPRGRYTHAARKIAPEDQRWTEEWRKPNPGMLKAAVEWNRDYCQDSQIDKGGSVMVGDLNTDREAAEAAGFDYYYTDAFFASPMEGI